MRDPIVIEDIEDMRRREGIEDGELRQEIRDLRAGDLVKVTLLSGPKSCETLTVRITSVKGSTFRGKLAAQPSAAGLSQLHPGSPIVFTAAHIHSIPRMRPSRDP